MQTNNPSEAAAPRRAAVVAGAIAFAALATLNAGGYRYGASDQAFYIPAILHQLDPSLFPRDWGMLGAQGKFFFVDELFAGLVRTTGLSLPYWFAAAQLTTLTVLYAGAYALGRQMLVSPWALTAWLTALTLRHRIAKTGANTLEGYFHPRMLVFGIGLASLALFMRGRRWWALGLAVASATLHPTTAALFVAVIGVGIVVSDPQARVPAIGVGVMIGAALVAGVTSGMFSVATMDAPWLALLGTKDYVFPTRWSLDTWAINLLGPVVVVVVGVVRYRAGLTHPRELGLLAGCLALVAGFAASLPFIAGGAALAVQLQTSRVFWPVETVAILSLVWLLVDRPARADRRARLPLAAAALLAAVSLSRAAYVGFFENPDRPTLALDLPGDDWTSALGWIRDHTPTNTYVLADPSHAWRLGTAVRIGAQRDVFLEETKDVAMAMYSRDAAERVTTRIESTQGFAAMTPAALTALAAREGLDVLVTERTLDLPVAHRVGAITIYRFAR